MFVFVDIRYLGQFKLAFLFGITRGSGFRRLAFARFFLGKAGLFFKLGFALAARFGGLRRGFLYGAREAQGRTRQAQEAADGFTPCGIVISKTRPVAR